MVKRGTRYYIVVTCFIEGVHDGLFYAFLAFLASLQFYFVKN